TCPGPDCTQRGVLHAPDCREPYRGALLQSGRCMNTPAPARKLWCRKVLAAGIWLFISGFLWAPSNDVLRVVFHLAFVFPLFFLWPWRSPNRAELGGCATGLALSLGALAVLSTLWGTAADMPHFLWQWVLLAAWLAGVSWWQA